MIDRAASHAFELLATVSLFAAITAWQEQVEWTLKITASLVAIICALGGLYYSRKRSRKR